MNSKQVFIILVIPGGGGKSTLSKTFGFIDIDSFWDPNGLEENELINNRKEALENKDQNLINFYINKCVLFKAKKCKFLLEQENAIILVQSLKQAEILTNNKNNIYCFVPSENLHNINMDRRQDSDYVKEICKKQRYDIVNSGYRYFEYNNYEILIELIKEKIKF